MFKYLLILPIICSFVLSATATEQRINQFLPKFVQYVEENMPNWAVPGMAIVIVTPDKVLLSKGFGTREVRKNKPVNEHYSHTRNGPVGHIFFYILHKFRQKLINALFCSRS